MTQLLLIPVMAKMRWTIYLKALAVKLTGSSLVKQQIVKNITGLHNGTKLKKTKQQVTYLQLVTYF